MPTYSYKARDPAGKAVKGTMEVADKAELITKLRMMGYMVTIVSEVAQSRMRISSILEKFKRVSSNSMLMFYIQFSNMIGAGITILMSLMTLAGQGQNRVLAKAIKDVSKRVEAGSTLSEALSSHTDIFPKLFVNMAKAGEASGNLEAVLMRYAVFFERQQDMKQKVRGALFYPVILLSFGLTVMLFIVTFVIPKFAELYLRSGVRLPIPTLIVYKLGILLKHYWYMLIAGAALIFFAVKFFMKTEKGTLFFDTLKLRLPIIGPLYRKIAVSRFARTLSTLLGSGVPILQALDITKDVLDNEVLSRVMESAHKYVEKGEKLSDPLRVSGEFPEDVVQMIAVGEETGSIDTMLNKIADFYDMVVDYAIKRLTTLIEPIFLLIMGGMVGLIMASMLLPIFDMVKTLRH